MKRPFVLTLAIAAVLPFSALAHKAWLQPSQTVLAGEQPWITVDAAVSNDLFYFNHVPLRLDTLLITAPDGSAVQPQNPATGKYRSVFDLELMQTGTYRLALVNDGLFANWNENGQRKRWRGNAASFASEVPKDAQDLQVSQALGRVETFVTNGAPNQTALTPSGRGLELLPVTHPNDLFAGEQATFTLHIDGKPAPGLDVAIVRGGTRYRNAQDALKLTTDAQGRFSVTWPEAGMYWLQSSSEDAKTSLPQARQRRLSYVATLEVLPQ
ncbi:DUF4198 domain-containing protein [Xanthomonas translucens]|uniref:DUF4198 domain-containing protein n=1 Tax=Xanthomonas campestris pv. translucens TaxID=343 RepID=UPI0002A7A6DA|nr:DUF4198 domain-containing protein [Xanthomonas translucens]AKK68333.1 ABC transporter permease [Xanthomonas translucens pv. undulosa]AVY66173.1 ABC transporter permease [Xanthomonas translucens pv. undulosa]ELQ00727.1 hypothetical protein A989_16643 [Xanthomonas translucens DAR61454]MBC3970887.1 DUF4198 domain-containing protein [Xanthomonas translucens pv. undulosa]MCT8271225.1 DUF4198 domain-containing protein [Xanthomonas translucens pv. undulosa]